VTGGAGERPTPAQDIASLLDVDPDLAEGLTPEDREAAGRLLVVRVDTVPAGTWRPAPQAPAPGTIATLVCAGLAVRRGSLGGRGSVELLGEGDVLRPWDENVCVLPVDVSWRVLERMRLVTLDERLAPALARYPSVLSAILQRTIRRSRFLSVQHLISGLPAVEQRLLLLFTLLADRWGRVRPGGVFVPIRMSHEMLAGLVGARRPSVTSAIGSLQREGAIRRDRDGIMLLDPGALLARERAVTAD
jgi:CRP/FNR family transcriptional regulator, cyclic AMP receptor protein